MAKKKELNQLQPSVDVPIDWEVIDYLIKNDDLYGLYRQEMRKFIKAYKDIQNTELAKSYKTVRSILEDWFSQELVTSVFGITEEEFLRDASLLRFQLIVKNLGLVIYFAKKKFHGFGNQDTVSFMDIVQAGNIGLITAVEKFDPDRGTEFSTYAGYWIVQSINKYGVYPMDTSVDLKETGRPLLRRIYDYHELYIQEKKEWIDISNPVFITAAYEYLKTLEQFPDLSYELVVHVLQSSQRVLSVEGLVEQREDESEGDWEKRVYQLGTDDTDSVSMELQTIFSRTIQPEQLDTLYTILGSTLPAKELEAVQLWHTFGNAYEKLSPEQQVDPTYLRTQQKKLLTTYNRALRRLKSSKALTTLYQEITTD